eukprot:COSAG05_NODE_499_length_9235_cov_51.826154_2_plen_74_part_00
MMRAIRCSVKVTPLCLAAVSSCSVLVVSCLVATDGADEKTVVRDNLLEVLVLAPGFVRSENGWESAFFFEFLL